VTDAMRARHGGPSWNRVAATLLILTAFFSPLLAGSRAVQAAPAAQAQNLCKLVPPGYDPSLVTDMADYCMAAYKEADGSTVYLELSRAYSPADVHDLMVSCHPSDCASAGACEGRPCQILDWGDTAPSGRDQGLRGVSYDPTPSQEGGLAYAFTRGCYLLEGETWDTAVSSGSYLWSRMLQADALVGTDPCAGCEDATVCQGTGTGGTGTSGTGTGGSTGGTTPAGTFAVSSVYCWYDASVDAANCEAKVVDARPDAVLMYDWWLDGVAQISIPGPQTLFAIGCTGEHTISVIVRDTKNNLSSIGMSTKVTSTYGAPCTGGTGTGLTLAAPNCHYSKVEDWLTCVAQVMEAPAGADLLFEWSLDGILQGETTESFDKWISPDGQAHTIAVMARDPASGKTSALTSYYFRAAAGAGSLQIQTASGTTSIGGANPTSMTSLVLTADDPLAKLLADCPLIGLVLLLELGFDGEAIGGVPGETSAAVTIAALVVECARLKAEGPLQIASVGDPALFLAARAAPEDLPVQLGIGLQGGPLRVHASSDQVQLDVQTSAASVRSAGQNDFGVHADAQTGETTVVVYGGTVEVYSSSTGAPIASLQAGQQVEVAADGAGEAGSGEPEDTGATGVGPYGEVASQPEGASDPEPGKSPLCGPLGVILPFVAVAAARRRR
jgi:hypothetical protein